MKAFTLLFLLLFSFSSCSDNDNDNDCLVEKLEIIEKYDRLIELAEGDEAQQDALIRNKNALLDRLDC